ncbi:single-stranded DNA-binding protein [Gilliamella sp. B3482]|uniref:single-stranded DNA-binding protein n=1 Tax=Gilliamella sp. B3482 TaxID=2817991 RepID=UPI00226A0993|nr:single-stranded DNA-binding protein [Gilliamella sp. B3482]MCX8580109.1 single-stranded DNA-binding protein [Gilliamella sp. B3482]
MAINTMTATGNVGQDAELRYLQNGTAVSEFSLPVKAGYGDNQKTAWIKCVIWGKVAEIFAPNIKKGDLVAVSGEFYVEEWEKNGVTVTKPCLRVNQIQPTKKLDGQVQPSQQQSQQQNNSQSTPETDINDDSIPF